MKKDKFKTYILELSLMFILIFALFVPNIFTKINLAIFLSIFSIITVFLLKKKNILSIHNKEVTIMMVIFAIITEPLLRYLCKFTEWISSRFMRG